MITSIVYLSYHLHNTEKVAQVMAEELEAELVSVSEEQPNAVIENDIIGFGSGIYGMKFHKTFIEFVEALTAAPEQ
ncbi:MAG: flavodoxin domain-containing protein [Halobacteriota archaeon]